MTIQVTQEDIDNGLRHSCGSCPVALAVNRAAGTIDSRVGVTIATVRGVDYSLPLSARGFIISFDCAGPYMANPFTFEMEPEMPRIIFAKNRSDAQ